MRLVTIDGIDVDSIAAQVRARTYAAGLVAAKLRGVVHMEWDDADDTLYAEVSGLDGDCHEVEVSSAAEQAEGWCSWAASAPARPGSTARTSSPPLSRWRRRRPGRRLRLSGRTSGRANSTP